MIIYHWVKVEVVFKTYLHNLYTFVSLNLFCFRNLSLSHRFHFIHCLAKETVYACSVLSSKFKFEGLVLLFCLLSFVLFLFGKIFKSFSCMISIPCCEHGKREYQHGRFSISFDLSIQQVSLLIS